MDVSGRRVTLMGLGTHGGGVAAARWLASQGARLTVTDLAPAERLIESLAALADAPIEKFVLGRHDEHDFCGADIVVVNPAVPMTSAFVELAMASGAQITSEIELFLERSPAPVIGVTGTNGKSTTATLIALMLTSAGYRTWLGGNIGRSLLGVLDEIAGDHRVVLELSSFQLARLSPQAAGPQISVITSFSPNHLDWHGSAEHYRRSKQRMIDPRCCQTAIRNPHDPALAAWPIPARVRSVPAWPLRELPPLAVAGLHNRTNAACAAAAAEQAGADRTAILEALAAFGGLEHRLQSLGEIDGRRIYNDAKSTTPSATIAALRAIDGRTWLMAGGQDKQADFAELAAAIVQRACGAALFGAARERIRGSIAVSDSQFAVQCCARLDDAFDWCMTQSAAGDAIILSPACASFDQYRDFNHRGREFASLVRHRAIRQQVV